MKTESKKPNIKRQLFDNGWAEVDGAEVDGEEVDGAEVDEAEVDETEVDGTEVDGEEMKHNLTKDWIDNGCQMIGLVEIIKLALLLSDYSVLLNIADNWAFSILPNSEKDVICRERIALITAST